MAKRKTTTQEKLESLSRKDILAFGITNIDLLDGKRWAVETRKWLPEIYNVVNPYLIEQFPNQTRQLIIQKSTQCGMSTMGLVRMFHFLSHWDGRAMYILPRQQDYLDMVNTRVDPMIEASPFLSDLLGKPDSTRSKRIGNSYAFFMESTVEPRMMPADMVLIDELDLSNFTHVGTARNRMDDSRWKMISYYSTPTLPGYGINNRFNNVSDKREWLVKCPQCNTYQGLNWEKNLRIEGRHAHPKDVWLGCIKCNYRLEHQVIQDHGLWVPEYPERDAVGFHISQLMTHDVFELYKIFRDPETTLVEFYRKRLGLTYEIGGGSITRTDLLQNCFREPYEAELMPDGRSSYYMGVDQGNELQVIIGKYDRETERNKIVHVELVDFNEGFERIGKLMNIWGIKLAVIDGDPNRHSVRKLTEKFPGRVVMADYAEIEVPFRSKKNDAKVLWHVAINRTEGFDRLINSIKETQWSLWGEASAISPTLELVLDQLTAIKRDIETRKKPSGSIEVAVWRELRPSHLAHAWLYLKTAMELVKKGRFRTAAIGAKTKKVSDEPEEVEWRPEARVISEIVPMLAQVSAHQFSEYLFKKNHVDYALPFPLSYLLPKVKERFEDREIEWVMSIMANPKWKMADFKLNP